MATWDEIRDEIAGMLADGKPLEDVIAKLEKRKNEMEKPQTNEEWLKSCNTEQLATFLAIVQYDGTDLTLKKNHVEKWVEWLKQPHIKE